MLRGLVGLVLLALDVGAEKEEEEGRDGDAGGVQGHFGRGGVPLLAGGAAAAQPHLWAWGVGVGGWARDTSCVWGE